MSLVSAEIRAGSDYDGGELSSPGMNLARPIEQEVTALYADLAPGLCRYAFALASNHEAARDAVQEAFLRYFEARTNGPEIASPAAWLFRVLRNHLLDAQRTASYTCEVALAEAGAAADIAADPERQTQEREFGSRIRELLSPREYQCMKLRTQGLHYSEIADRLGLKVGSVSSLISRAQRKIRQEMG
jgi:RNA polymerase sigma-70 factor (ECF subfamily)